METPFYHSYLQTLPTATPGDALLDSGSTAGQFNIIDGQLVYNTGSGTTDALYMWVEDPSDTTQRTLKTWFNTTENTYGTFVFSGDTVTWVDPDISNRNAGAFYVCPANSTTGENSLFVNTGAYAYDTPDGCYDVDVRWTTRPLCEVHRGSQWLLDHFCFANRVSDPFIWWLDSRCLILLQRELTKLFQNDRMYGSGCLSNWYPSPLRDICSLQSLE